VLLSTVAGLASNAAEPVPSTFPAVFDGPSADAPSADEAPPPAEPIEVRTAATDFELPTLRSRPVRRASRTLPAPPAAAPAGADGHGYEAPDLDRLPILANEDEAARVLAAAFARTGRAQARLDTAILWLRVGSGGRVTQSQVLFSTSREVAEASVATLPYLRFTPGEKDGRAVPAWVQQPMIVVP